MANNSEKNDLDFSIEVQVVSALERLNELEVNVWKECEEKGLSFGRCITSLSLAMREQILTFEKELEREKLEIFQNQQERERVEKFKKEQEKKRIQLLEKELQQAKRKERKAAVKMTLYLDMLVGHETAKDILIGEGFQYFEKWGFTKEEIIKMEAEAKKESSL